MAINFAAADMAGYNNPEVHVFPVAVKMDGQNFVVDSALNYSTISNIIKSGYMPYLFVTLPTGDRAVLPLVAINYEGIYIFSIATYTSTSPSSKQLISIMYGSTFAPKFLTQPID